MSAAGDIVNNTADAAENPVAASEIPLNDKASISDNTGIDKEVGAENPATGQSDGTLNHVNNQTGVAENPELNDKASIYVNTGIDKEVGAENPATGQSDGTLNHVNNQAGVAENPELNDKASIYDNTGIDKEVGAENPATRQSDGALNHVNNQAGVAEKPELTDKASIYDNTGIDEDIGAENPATGQSDGASNHVNNQAGVAEKPELTDKASIYDNTGIDEDIGAENPATGQSDGASNHVNNQAGVAENPELNDKSSIYDNTGIDKEVGEENPATGQSDGALNHVNNQAGVAENPEEGSADNLAKDQSDRAEGSGNDTTGTAENSVNDKAEYTEDDLNDKASDVNDPESDKADADETPVISVDSLPVEAKELLISLASKWEDIVDENALQVISVKGAMTNEVFQIKWPRTTGETSQKVILRIYGQGVDIFFDREDETRTFEFMSKSGYGPRLLGRFANGRIEEFIHARTLSASDLRDPSISGLIAAKMKEFHNLDMPGEKKVYLWDRLRNWLKEAKQLSSPQEVEAFYLDTIDKEITILEKELPGAHQQIGFCHNDLQYGNIMLDEETNSVTMIDYEYASYNPVAYDIANHFCEMAANYHTETPHILNYNKYPDVEERQRFVQAYLSSSGEEPNEGEVEQLLQEIEKYTLANHLFWGIWGIISAQVNTIDFDYKEYAKQRFQEYWARKPYLLISSEAPSPYNAPEGTGELASASAHKSSTKNIFKKMKKVLGLGLFKSKN